MKKILFILIILYFIFLIRQDIINFKGLNDELAMVLKNLSLEQVNKIELEKAQLLLSQPEQIEALARTRLMLIKKGEVAFKVF